MPGFSAWWFLVAIGTWNSYWRHLNNTYSTRARWIHPTLSVVVVVELGGEENILLASPPSWRRVHHATLEPGRACKKRLQVLLQDITVLNVTNCFTRERNTLLIATPCFCFPDGDISVPSPCSREPVPSRKKVKSTQFPNEHKIVGAFSTWRADRGRRLVPRLVKSL